MKFWRLTGSTAGTVAGAISVLLSGVGATGAVGTLGGAAILPAIAQARTSGVAPLSVFFDASATTASTLTSLPFHELYYVWDYGDGSAGTWTMGARSGLSKNISYGPMGSHCYETAGTYTATLYVYHYSSGGILSTASLASSSITVTAADTYYSGSNTICFSTSGNFTGAPFGATQVTQSNYKAAIDTYKGTGKRLLFRAGETFTATSSVSINYDGPSQISTFGSGADAIFDMPTGQTVMTFGNSTSQGYNDFTMYDIELDGNGLTDTRAIGGSGSYDQVTFLRVNIHDHTNGFTLSPSGLDYWNNNGDPGHTIWDQWSLIEVRQNNINGGVEAGGYGPAYLGVSRLTFMGNDWDSNGGGEHTCRMPFVDRAVISNSYFANPASTKHNLKLHCGGWSLSGVSSGGKYSEKIVVSENTFKGGTNAWPVNFAPQNDTSDERLRDIICERNYLLASSATTVGIQTIGPVFYFTARNNIFNMSLATISQATGLNIGEGAHVGPAGTNHYAYNNTIYSSSTLNVRGISYSSGIVDTVIYNNLAYTPSSTTAVVLSGTGGTGFLSGNNSSDSQCRSTNPLFSTIPSTSATQLASTDFKITTGSYGINGGTYVPVFEDFSNVSRTGAYDIGALQP